MNKQGNPAFPEGEAGEKMLLRMNKSHKTLRDWAFKYINWQDNIKILDVGCGGGATIAHMLQLSANSTIYGIDYSQKSVEASSEYNKDYLNDRVFIKKADVTKLPFEDNTFDIITAVETIYFWPEVDKALAELYRVLKKGAKLVNIVEASDPNALKLNGWPKIDGHFKVYTMQEYKDMFNKACFKEIECFNDDRSYGCVIGVK